MRFYLNRSASIRDMTESTLESTAVGDTRVTLDKVNDAIKQAAEKMSLYPLKPKQFEAIMTFMSGKDTFVSLPTGYGKSAIYAVLPFAFDCLLGT